MSQEAIEQTDLGYEVKVSNVDGVTTLIAAYDTQSGQQIVNAVRMPWPQSGNGWTVQAIYPALKPAAVPDSVAARQWVEFIADLYVGRRP
jgi:hypothetical protein